MAFGRHTADATTRSRGPGGTRFGRCTRHYLYVIGGLDGLDGTGAALDSYERAIVLTAGSDVQVLDASGFVTGTEVLPTTGGQGPRWQLGAVFFDSTKSTLVTGDDVF